jgi:hypothetical protein
MASSCFKISILNPLVFINFSGGIKNIDWGNPQFGASAPQRKIFRRREQTDQLGLNGGSLKSRGLMYSSFLAEA